MQDDTGRYWLEPVELANNRGFRDHEFAEIRKMVMENREFFLEKWHEYFSRNH
jgi:hypothetical protein